MVTHADQGLIDDRGELSATGERQAEDRHFGTWAPIDDRLDMDLDPYPDSGVY
jgi:hypothetical protein